MKDIDEIKKEVLKEVAEGRVNIPSPYYGDKCLPENVKLKVSEPEPFFHFTNPDDAYEAVDFAKKRIDSFVDYVNSEHLHVPEMHFNFPQSGENVYLPNSSGFGLDQKINVSVLRDFGKKCHVNGTCQIRGVPAEFSYDRYSPIFARHGRAHKPVKQDGKVYLEVVRSPIAWSINNDSEIKRSANLVVSVAESMLEPWTSDRVAYLIEDDVSEAEMYKLNPSISNRAKLEESILAETLTKLWLLDTQQNISADEIFSTRLRELGNVSPEFIQSLAGKIRDYGIEDAVYLYSSKHWSLPTLIDKIFKRKDDGEEDEL